MALPALLDPRHRATTHRAARPRPRPGTRRSRAISPSLAIRRPVTRRPATRHSPGYPAGRPRHATVQHW